MSSPASDATTTRARWHVLLVEDDFVAAAILTETFDQLAPDMAVTTAGTLEEACAHLRVATVHLVICDLHLPDADGPAIVSGVRGDAPTQPLVVMSGADDPETVDAARRAGAGVVLRKGDVGGDEVVGLCRRLLSDDATAGA